MAEVSSLCFGYAKPKLVDEGLPIWELNRNLNKAWRAPSPYILNHDCFHLRKRSNLNLRRTPAFLHILQRGKRTKFHTMTFGYAKVDDDSRDHDEHNLDEHQARLIRGRSTIWTKTLAKFKMLRWPVTVFMLVTILTCELSILRKQPPSLPIGGEINGLVPHCK
jgi:hypothetical protein